MYDPKQAQKDRELSLAKLRDATEEDETSEVVARAVEGGVRGALASIREGDDSEPPPVSKKSHKRIVALVVAIVSILSAVLAQVLGNK